MEEDLRRTGASVAKRYPIAEQSLDAAAVPLKQEIVGTAESTLVVLAGAASLVLLLACVNVAGLLLGRASSRSREIGVSAALGATRWRLARQLLVESVVLAAAGGVVGIAPRLWCDRCAGALRTAGHAAPADDRQSTGTCWAMPLRRS